MLLSWWCPLGHGKRHLPAIQIFIAVRLIPILTHLSSGWTVPLSTETIFNVLDPYSQCCESGSVGSICFGPPGSGSFYHQEKNSKKKPWFLLFCDFFMTSVSLKNDVNVTSKSDKQKTLEKKCFLLASWRSRAKIACKIRNWIRVHCPEARICTTMSRIHNISSSNDKHLHIKWVTRSYINYPLVIILYTRKWKGTTWSLFIFLFQNPNIYKPIFMCLAGRCWTTPSLSTSWTRRTRPPWSSQVRLGTDFLVEIFLFLFLL